MDGYLAGRTVGFVVAQDGVEEDELVGPRRVLDAAGARTLLIAPMVGEIKTRRDGLPCDVHDVDRTLSACAADELDALVLPDGHANSSALREEPAADALVRAFAGTAKPVGAFGYAVWSLLDADLLQGRQVTSHASMRRELEQAGARWHDRRVVVDENLITSRTAADVEAFIVQLVAYLDR